MTTMTTKRNHYSTTVRTFYEDFPLDDTGVELLLEELSRKARNGQPFDNNASIATMPHAHKKIKGDTPNALPHHGVNSKEANE
jgi:hypothetical protein